MNIKFRILWFEDELAWYNMEKLRIERFLAEHFLIPDIERTDGSDFELEKLIGNDFDLILMDYKLFDDKKVTGDKIATAIRKNNILTDILLYSGAESDMLAAINNSDKPLDGVYYSKRDEAVFTPKIERLIEKIVKRSEDIINLRGFVLDNTSEFEVRIKEILNICWENFDEDSRRTLQEKVLAILDNKISCLVTEIDRVKTSDDVFDHANKHKYLLSINDRLDIFQEIINILLNVYDMEESEVVPAFKNYYVNNISVYRNQLGHVKVGERTITIKGKPVNIDQNLHRLLRKNISQMDKDIFNIESFVNMIFKKPQ